MSRNERTAALLVFLLFGLATVSAQEPLPASDADILLSKAFDLFKREQFVEAAEAFGALAQDPAAGGSGGEGLAVEASYLEIAARINARDLDKAESLARAFLAAHPGSLHAAELEYQRGRISFLGGRYEEAIARFAEFVETRPGDPFAGSALFWKAESFYLLGRTKEAYEGLSAFLSSYPDSPKRGLAEWRLEVIGLEAREGSLRRVSDFDKAQGAQRAQEAASAERREERNLEREYALLGNLRSLYGFSGAWRTPLYAEKTIVEAPKPPQRMPDPALLAEKARANRLKELLAAKSVTLELLTKAVLAYAEELSK